jgi:hypothetical protein
MLVGKSERKRSFGRPRHERGIILKLILRNKSLGCGWIHLVQYRGQWRALVNIYTIRGIRGKDSHCYHLDYDTVYSGRWILTFTGNILLHFQFIPEERGCIFLFRKLHDAISQKTKMDVT